MASLIDISIQRIGKDTAVITATRSRSIPPYRRLINVRHLERGTFSIIANDRMTLERNGRTLNIPAYNTGRSSVSCRHKYSSEEDREFALNFFLLSIEEINANQELFRGE